MTALITSISSQRSGELRAYAAERRRAAKARRRHTSEPQDSGSLGSVSIRRLDASGADRASLLQLAGRDSRPVPAGESIGAELDGRLVAVAPIEGGDVISDPFSPTAEIRALLELRVAQLRSA